MSSRSYIYRFGRGQADGSNALKDLVGGKGASLAEMTRAGLNVPPGFTISAESCDLYYKAGRRWPEGLQEQVRAAMTWLEELSERRFGQGDQPLLVAVRSGAAQSMPGMMDTVLNVGLHPEVVQAVAQRTGNPRAAWEAYYHFLLMFGHIVGGVEENVLAGVARSLLEETGQRSVADLDAALLELLCDRLRAAYREHTAQEIPTEPDALLFQAIEAVFRSWNNERAVTYRRHHRIEGLLGTAVNVQMMCPSEVSGVMFTVNPVSSQSEIVIESSFGLGEAVVLGKVTPDRFVLRRPTSVRRAEGGRRIEEAPAELEILERTISQKNHFLAALPTESVIRHPPSAMEQASLRDEQVLELAQLGLRVESYFKTPCDIEWGLSRGQFYLLQARPIKGGEPGRVSSGTADPAELEQLRQEEIARLRSLAEPGGTVWSRYNLAEILPEPTPMTWAIVRRFMSGRGGFGLMYRDLGFDPDPKLDEIGIFDLVCGRPYCNLSREPRLQYRSLPFEHPFAALKDNPARALYPQAVFNPARAPWHFWLRIPFIFFRLWLSASRLQHLMRTFAADFRQRILPAFVAETEKETRRDLSLLEPAALLERLEYWIRRTLVEFARDSLKPTALAGMALGNLERGLTRIILAQVTGRPAASPSAEALEQARQIVGELVMGVHPDPEADLPAALRELRQGRMDRAEFLRRFGHRGHQEMELAQPRWAEDPESVNRVAGAPRGANASRAEQDAPRAEKNDISRSPLDQLQLIPPQRAALEAEVAALKEYLSLRETAKHALMRGYALIRQHLVELDRRWNLEGGIFYLTPEELPGLLAGTGEVRATIEQRRRRRALLLQLPVPQVIFSDNLEAIGQMVELPGSDVLQGVPLSAGVVEGMALVLEEPPENLPEGDYILVCPSTDPAWVPLFSKARGLVMETGGVLSHGAILAREFGLPAVAGLPAIHRRLRTGQQLRIDGGSGKVNVLAG